MIELQSYEIQQNLITNAAYLEFIADGGYEKFQYWHADGWEWVIKNKAKAPLYWYLIDGKWFTYRLEGLHEIKFNQAVCHVNFYEASAFAAWKEMRLPTEAEWELASEHFHWGQRWEWTNSAYLLYLGFQKAAGAIGGIMANLWSIKWF